jgi:hypothetical protein
MEETMTRFAIWALAVCPLGAQWVHLPTPGIPRKADGKPNLKAPAPRTAAGKPDFSGLWEKMSDKYYNNVTVDLKPGDVLPWADALYQERRKGFGKDSADALCLPFGPAYAITPFRDTRIVQTPTLIVMLYDDLRHREIFMDGRKLEKDPNPSWMGYSVGHWEGDTLVVESNGYSDRTWLDYNGHPHTENLRVTERYKRTDFGHINLQVTFDDPKAYAHPWTVPILMDLETDVEMLEYGCSDNEKDLRHMSGSATPLDLVVPAEVLKTYAGTYEVKEMDGTTSKVEFFAEEKGLFLNYDGQGKQPLDALSDTTFSLVGTLFEFLKNGQEFKIKSAEGEVTGVRKK